MEKYKEIIKKVKEITRYKEEYLGEKEKMFKASFDYFIESFVWNSLENQVPLSKPETI